MKANTLLIVLFGFMSLGLTEAQVASMFPEGAVVVTAGGPLGCLKSACIALKETFNPETMTTTTKVYVGSVDFGPDGSITGFSVNHNSRFDVYDEGKVMVGGELVSRGDNLIGPPPGIDKGGATKYVLSDAGKGTGVTEELVPEQTNVPETDTDGADTNADAGLETLGRIAFGILSSKLSYTSGKNAHLELLESLIKVEGAIQKLNIQSTQMTKFAGHLVGQGIQVPPQITQATNNYDPNKESRIVDISSLSEVTVHLDYPKDRISKINQKIKDKNLEALAKDVDLLADQGTSEIIKKSNLGKQLNDGVLKTGSMGFEGGIYDDYKFQSSAKSVYGKMIRRAANKAQLAQAHALSLGRDLVADSAQYNLSVAMVNIADQRFAAQGMLKKYIAQAEGMVRTAEEVFDVMGPGVAKGVQESLVGYADAVYAIPEMGDNLYEAAKYAANNPKLAVEKIWEVLGEAPEFVQEVYTQGRHIVENFHTLPLAEQSELVGNLLAEGGVTLATGGAGKALKTARVATLAKSVNTAKTIGKTRFVTKVTKNLDKTAKSLQTTKFYKKTRKILVVETAEDVNKSFVNKSIGNGSIENPRPPYKSGTVAVTYKNSAKEQFVRLHGPSNRNGQWVMKKEAVADLSPKELKSKYSLKFEPTHISELELPEGTVIRRGVVETNFGGAAGATQYEILDLVDESWFKGTKGLK